MNLITVLGQLRLLAILEGISYLLLIPTMVLKYGYEMGLPNMIVGSIHGLLFILYCVWVVYYAIKKKWGLMKTLICLAASLFPFATFVVDQRILKIEAVDELQPIKSEVSH
jgi:integral membrane protein